MRFIVFSALLLFCVPAISQVKLGVFAGPQLTTSRYTIKSVKQITDYKVGWEAGVTAKIPFDTRLYFAPALYYSLKGYKVNFNAPSLPPDSNAINNNTQIHTLVAAPLLHFDLTNHPAHFFIQFGPALDFVLAGKEKFDLNSGAHINRSMSFSFTDYGYVTASAVLHFGYETENGLLIFAHYTYGLGNANNADLGPQIQHRDFGISIGKYLYGRLK